MSARNEPTGLPAHLTHVERLGLNSWEASCLCGWRATKANGGSPLVTKGEAVRAAEAHWYAHQGGAHA